MTRTFEVCFLVGLVGCARGVSHESLMQRHIEARGGRAALESLRVVERNGSFTFHGMSPEAKGTYHTCLKYPDRVVVDIDAGSVQVHQVLGDNGAFECDATFRQCMPAQPSVVEDLKKTAQIANREEIQEELPPAASVELIYAQSEPVGYRYKKEHRLVEVEFAPDTGLERRIKRGPRERLYAQWQDAGGVLIPMQITDLTDGAKHVSIVLTEAKLMDEPSEWCVKRLAAGAQQAVPAEASASRPRR